MKVFAKHEKDDEEHLLDIKQMSDLEQDSGCNLQSMFDLKVSEFHFGGYDYRIEVQDNE